MGTNGKAGNASLPIDDRVLLGLATKLVHREWIACSRLVAGMKRDLRTT
jgi:hypothetical protein